jgi:ABC-type phosphate transport system permease subunit
MRSLVANKMEDLKARITAYAIIAGAIIIAVIFLIIELYQSVIVRLRRQSDQEQRGAGGVNE